MGNLAGRGRRWTSRRLGPVALVGLWWIGLAGVPARADNGPATSPAPGRAPTADLALRHFERGVALARRERLREAEREFVAAWALAQRPSIAFNMATVRYRLGEYVAALGALDDYQRVAGQGHSHAAEAARLRRMLEERVAHVSLELAPATARVFVDGSERPGRGRRRRFVVDPGPHEVKVVANRHLEATERLTVSAGGVLPLSIVLRPAPERSDRQSPLGGSVGAATGGGAPLAVAAVDDGAGSSRWVALGTGAVGALSLMASAGLSLAALERDGASESDCDGNRCLPEGHAARAQALEYGRLATVTGIAGGVLLASGLAAYLVIALGSEAPPPVGALVSPRGLGTQVQVRI